MRRALNILLCVAALCGCATREPALSLPESRLAQVLLIGQSSKAQVQAALGPAKTLAFDSGYEVWLYRVAPAVAPWSLADQSAEHDTELVILFDPNGVLKKTRRREAPPPAPP